MEGSDFQGHPLESCEEAINIIQRINRRKVDLPHLLYKYYGREGAGIWVTDFLVFAAARRTMSVTAAFLSVIRDKNFGVAAALLRMQLDTALRFSGMFYVDGAQEYASDVLSGKRIDKLRAKDGQRLTDKYLGEKLSEQFPWILRVYENTSGFVHLSDRHIFQTFHDVNDADRTIGFSISDTDVPRPPEEYIEILSAFEAATNLIVVILENWLNGRPKTAQVKARE